MDIAFAGTSPFALPSLDAIVARGHRLVSIWTQPDRPAGRGRKSAATAVAQWAEARGLAAGRTEDINREALPTCDVLVVIAFGQKISPALRALPRLGAVNLHGSRLPRWRGAAPVAWAILEGDKVTGNSVIRLADRMDAGAVLGISQVVISEDDTTGTLHDRLAVDGAGLLVGVLDGLAAGTAKEFEQDEALVTRARKIGREDAVVDFSWPGEKVRRQIHGFSPSPGVHVVAADASGKEVGRLLLEQVKLEACGSPAGMLDAQGRIGCGDGMGVLPVRVRPEGGKSQPMKDYRNGHAWPEGAKVQSR